MRKKRIAIVMGGLLVGLALCLLVPGTSWGQASTLYFFSVKKGLLDPTSSGDTYLEQVETAEGHGDPNDDRIAQPLSFELDIYGISSSGFGLGVGLETLGYTKAYFFSDGEIVHIRVKGVHFTFKTFLRFGTFLPFLGLGIGNYYANISQSNGLSIRESPEEVYNGRVGFLWQFGRMGFLLETGTTQARVIVPAQSGNAELELGGDYTNLGLSWMF